MAALLAGALAVLLPPAAFAAENKADPEQIKFFEMKVRPLLVDRCSKCHGEKKQKNDLRLDTLQAILKGGQTGPALVAGKPGQSLLIKAISYTDDDLRMPPKEKLTGEGGKLPDDEIAILTDWIRMGAPWPEGVSLAGEKKHRRISAEDRAFWSFQPVKDYPAPPADERGWCRNEIDRFIFAKLKAEDLTPAPEAERTALIRRATFDLHGLPPTPEEIDSFLADTSPGAYEKLIDRLLASPRYGERWGRHWLDLVRYAESDGFKQDSYRPHAWPYRDYVIKSFNQDKPYDRFVAEQLAGDEIAPGDPDVLAGASFLRLSMYEYNQRDVQKQWSEYLNDITDVTGDVFLGLGMGCARCHDHKFDPILQADYFRLQAFFSALLPRQDLVLATPEQKTEHAAAFKKWEEKTAALREQIGAVEKPYLEKVTKPAINKFPPEVRVMMSKPPEQRSPFEEQISELAYRQVLEEQQQIDGKIKGADREKWTALKRQLADFDDAKPKPLQPAFVATDVGSSGPPAIIPGDKQQRVFEPGFLTVLNDPAPKIEALPSSTGRRSALAKWLTRPEHPLTSRVIANRIWQYHFGAGLVSTSSDFGHLGTKPTHPELLDWLAAEFIKNGWSMKKMHRLVMTSSTYRQSAVRSMPAAAKLKDPENRWLWRMPVRRLEAEQIRDAMLAVSGDLSLTAGGPSADYVSTRRSIYTKVLRNNRDPLIETFDGADGIASSPARNITTTATQALLMINGQWPLQRAEAFAARLRKNMPANDARIVSAAYRLAFGREPDDGERAAALEFLERKPAVPANPETVFEKPPAQTMPHRGGQAALFHNVNADDLLRAADNPDLPTEDFTVEAVVLLESLYENASVRVIAAQWDSARKKGWSLGVTSEKSKYQPRNVILELGGKDGYEVIASDLRIELHKTYYLAVSVNIRESGPGGVTFYLRDLSDPDATLRVAGIPHKNSADYHIATALTIGGREGVGWDGLIDEIKISKGVLTKEQLLLNEPDPKQIVIADWRFEDDPGFFKDSAGHQPELTRSGTGKGRERAPADKALIDFCHVLLNSNEFLYVE